MKHLLILLCLLCPLLVSATQEVPLKQVLQELDRTILNRAHFIEQKEMTLDSLKLQLKAARTPKHQYALFNELFEAYK